MKVCSLFQVPSLLPEGQFIGLFIEYCYGNHPNFLLSENSAGSTVYR